ncbi:MAG: LytR C-terminal domain-containing protein [Gemmatimonadota bacterium]
MKRSRSGTTSSDRKPRGPTLVLIAALAVVLAFAGSFIFGLRTPDRTEVPAEAPPVPAPSQPVAVRDTRVRVEVLTGAGRSGLARLATQRLRAAGFDVVEFGNAGSMHAKSQVLDRVGKPQAARAVAQALGITSTVTSIDTTRYVDVSVILGKDFN